MNSDNIDYRILFENAPGLFLVLSPQLKIVAVTNQYLNATMTERSSILNKGIFEVFPDNPDDLNANGVSNLRMSLTNVVKNRAVDIMAVQRYDIRKTVAEGGGFEVRYWSPINSPVLDEHGQVSFIIHRVEDVTEYIKQKSLEEENIRRNEKLQTRAVQMETEIYTNAQVLQQMNKKLEAARLELDNFFNVSLDMLCIAGPDGYFKRVNPAFEMILGFTQKEMTSRPFYEFIHPEDIEKTKSEVEKQIVKHQKVFNFENRYRHKDGSYKLLSWKSVPVGEYMYAAARDITTEAETQKKIQKLNQELESFSYSVSHDLRAPIRSVVGFSKILEEDCYDKLNESERDQLKRIKRAAEKMGQLVDGLLNLARLNRVELFKTTVDLSQILKDVAAEQMGLNKERQIEFIIPGDIMAPGDPVLLRAVVSNLIENACKFTSKKVLTRIEFGLTENKKKKCFFLKDNGAGFDMRHANKLFGTFQRLHTESEFPGTGIGLASVKRIIERHGGEIWAESVPNEGTIFYFTL